MRQSKLAITVLAVCSSTKSLKRCIQMPVTFQNSGHDMLRPSSRMLNRRLTTQLSVHYWMNCTKVVTGSLQMRATNLHRVCTFLTCLWLICCLAAA